MEANSRAAYSEDAEMRIGKQSWTTKKSSGKIVNVLA
jgi:hypothetical protein